jgi:CelD/BcsL family acetyltransferase involved in cellulose biosynthesis
MEPGVSGLPAATAPGTGERHRFAPSRDLALTVELRRDLDLGPDDAAALDRLIEGRPGVGVFVSRAWLSGFFSEPPARSEPALLILRQGHALRGVVPIAIRRMLTHVRVGLLGGGAGSDRVDLLAARGAEAACSDAFLSWLADSFGRGGFVLDLRDVPGGSPLWGAVHRAGHEWTRPLVLQPRDVHTLPYLDLAGRSAEPGSLDKHRRWLERRGRLRIDTLHEPADVTAAFEALVRFLHVRWSGQRGGSALDAPRLLRLHRHALPLLLGEGRLRMIRLSSDVRTIAVFYGLATAGWWGYYLAGYDREWAGRIHLGQIALASAIQLAAQEGAAEFDFLKGAHRVKYLWPVRERATVDAEIYSAHPGPQLVRATRATREAAVAFAKSARRLFVRNTHAC